MSRDISSEFQPDILIVDDIPENLRLLSQMLLEQGYKVRKAINGQRALQAVEAETPDLILLDIMMPELDGYQVAKYLKDDPTTREIPIIFLSALSDTMDKVLAFDVGGVDYITKPFHVQEVLARVRTQLTISQQKQQLITQNQQLEREIRERQKIESALRIYIHAMSHDLRNPVTGMLMVLQNLLKKIPENYDELPVAPSILKRMANSCTRQLALINSLVQTSNIELKGIHLNCQSLNLRHFTNRLSLELELILQKEQAAINNQISENLPSVNADPNQLWRVFDNLLSNAIKYNPPGIIITLSAELITEVISPKNTRVKLVRCTVQDNGNGMSEQELEGIFDLYKRGRTVGNIQGLGLGLYLCRQIINAHGGKIGAIATPKEGATFWFTLPIFDDKLYR
ncbi:MAG: hybrid sensor histidine kinase/response regulator [Limnospira sp. PMC 1291.21]|uniref:histidine kinase n=3 Tax=Limnospira TaxID=2596745 RepID=A0A9P1NXT4_9CYAN|nr:MULTISPECIES: hybrid sensor histidine kinase/response regulator [Limnospira]EKD10486.1 response regulator receiver sensor signal transduction histidine kinase [Arthrospira platensis C1]MDC0836436.1 hybrid sensor histidine kinase/response regulator [Limnoraphis robusta]MDY7052415.1 hybrid sensor histidine kinase/response regulator [Limnospira fusiformis LS22]QJB28287.1 response regulator [Limnospira fusiformis SAG 85.79]RAQ49013.1 hybrid sensor histidine kinase/response regulator [Arthrospir